jgi:hypothetical protein
MTGDSIVLDESYYRMGRGGIVELRIVARGPLDVPNDSYSVCQNWGGLNSMARHRRPCHPAIGRPEADRPALLFNCRADKWGGLRVGIAVPDRPIITGDSLL